MFNLNNDVLNKERRKLFPKIDSITKRLSLFSLNHLKKQNPYKFYNTFYNKYFYKKAPSHSSNSKHYLSLISSSRNYYFSLPIKFSFSCENFSPKNERDIELNKLNEKESEKNSYSKKKNEMLFEDKEILYIDFLKNKELKNLHNNIIRLKNYSNIKNLKEAKNNNHDILLRLQKRSKSCVNSNIFKNLKNKNYKINLNKRNFNKQLTNIFPTSKRSQEQQTDESELSSNRVNNKINNQQNSKNNEEIFIEAYKFNKRKNCDFKEEEKFCTNFIKNKNKKNENENINVFENRYIQVYWNNLRRPLVINPSKSISIKPSKNRLFL